MSHYPNGEKPSPVSEELLDISSSFPNHIGGYHPREKYDRSSREISYHMRARDMTRGMTESPMEKEEHHLREVHSFTKVLLY